LFWDERLAFGDERRQAGFSRPRLRQGGAWAGVGFRQARPDTAAKKGGAELLLGLAAQQRRAPLGGTVKKRRR